MCELHTLIEIVNFAY